MQRFRNVLILGITVFALPLFGQGIPANIEIVVDLNAHRAYVPYGTVVPHGMQVRVARRVVRRSAKILNDDFIDGSLATNATDPHAFLAAQSPLVFEYAPESRFEESRKRFRAISKTTSGGRFTVKPLSRSCGVTTVQVESEGQYGTEYASFDSTVCYTAGVGFNESDTRDFTAHTYAQDETWAHVTGDQGNYSCFNQYYGFSIAECTASHTGFMPEFNHAVYVEGFARHYEWGDNYAFAPVDFFFSVSYWRPADQ